MAQENTQSDYQEIEFKKRARRRLVGSIALVLLMIVLLPMVLVDKHIDSPHQDLVITIPSEDSNASVPNTTANSSSPAPVETALPNSDSSSETNQDKTVATDTSAEQPKSAESNKPVEPSKNAEAKTGNVMVQVGVFADSANAKQIQSKLEANGFKVQTTSFNNGKLRLRVGPYSNRAEAEAAVAKLQTLKFNPMVVND